VVDDALSCERYLKDGFLSKPLSDRRSGNREEAEKLQEVLIQKAREWISG
jgi:hypothetical protein